MTDRPSGIDRIERELALLDGDAAPPADWEARVLATIANERIERELSQLDAAAEPRAGWEKRVLAATAERPKRRRWWALAIPAFACAALAAWVFVLRPLPLALAVDLERTGEATLAATSAIVGSVARITADGGPNRAVWVYRDDHVLVLACPGDARCRDGRRSLEVNVTLDTIAVYRVVALSSSSAIPQPRGSYDEDVAAARSAGSELTTRALTVR